MLKKFNITIPLGIEDSYMLVKKSGDEIVSWRASNISEKDHYLEWKQSFWSLTGTTLISVTMQEKRSGQTEVTVMIHKPMQLFDPVSICYRVFRKLEKAVERNFERSEAGG
ncbi:MAG: hypothetical protein LJE64_11395 [Desulfofustis sp.]|jgi:hypothetical protein|nr:hypothetical protein [Desulfofustis sp.]